MIPDETWVRLRALDRRCDLELLRLDTAGNGYNHTTGRNYPRMWRVVIRDRVGPEHKAVTSEAPRLADAISGAVVMAELYGWGNEVTGRSVYKPG
jgi:hypothetical protein